MNFIKHLLLRFIWNNDVKCMHLVLAPEWIHGQPYGFYIRQWSDYIKAHPNSNKDSIPKEVLASMYFKRDEFCGVVKGAYIAREAIEVEKLYKQLGQMQKIVPFKIALLTKIAMHYDIDKMYGDMKMPFQRKRMKK